jgi:hypothetical protein
MIANMPEQYMDFAVPEFYLKAEAVLSSPRYVLFEVGAI